MQTTTGLQINGRVTFRNAGSISVGKNVRINSGRNYNVIGGDIRTSFVTFPDSHIVIGDNVGISNSTFVSKIQITIEDNVMIGGSCKFYDTDFHSVDPESRLSEIDGKIKSKRIVIANGAFIGAHSIILKGSRIGKNSVIGAGSVVAGNVPDNEIWAGNPARKIGQIGKCKDAKNYMGH